MNKEAYTCFHLMSCHFDDDDDDDDDDNDAHLIKLNTRRYDLNHRSPRRTRHAENVPYCLKDLFFPLYIKRTNLTRDLNVNDIS